MEPLLADASHGSDDEQDDSVTVALRLLAAIADDPLMRASYRVAARRHLRRLERQADAAR